MTQKEIAAKWKVDRRTVNRWQKVGAPLDDDAAMSRWIDERRSRTGVSKYSPKQSEAIVSQVVEIERVQPLPIIQTAPTDDPQSTLARLEEAERIAYKRYIDTGGSERAAQVWLLVCDQKRKLIADQAKQASDISEAETKFISDCWQVVWELFEHFKSMPALLGMICEGLDREVIQAKADDQIQRTIGCASKSLAAIMRGTSLEILLPEHARTKQHEKIDRS